MAERAFGLTIPGEPNAHEGASIVAGAEAAGIPAEVSKSILNALASATSVGKPVRIRLMGNQLVDARIEFVHRAGSARYR